MGEQRSDTFLPWEVLHGLAGSWAGAVATTLLQPLDLVKTRFQVQTTRTHKGQTTYGVGNSGFAYRSTWHALTTIVKSEGIIGLYQGLTPNILGSTTAWGSYFFVYNVFKGDLERRYNVTHLGPSLHLLAATEAGVVTAFLTNPIWVIKTRLQLQTANNTQNYKGITDAVKTIYKEEGFKGYYKGMIPALFGVSHGALQFMAYEEMRHFFKNEQEEKLNSAQYFLIASASKVFATLATYPYQVVKSRLQERPNVGSSPKYSGVWDVITKIWKFEGPLAFYNGLVPNILRVTPAAAITFVVYEKTMEILKGV